VQTCTALYSPTLLPSSTTPTKVFVERQDIGNTKNKKRTVVGFFEILNGEMEKEKNKGLGL
jgi:hypothetical protein